MANVYQLKNPDIDIIICYCQDMDANEKTEIYDFGKNRDLILHIYKDEDYNSETGEYDLVRIHTMQYGKTVDDSGDIYISERELGSELERIYNYIDFGTY